MVQTNSLASQRQDSFPCYFHLPFEIPQDPSSPEQKPLKHGYQKYFPAPYLKEMKRLPVWQSGAFSSEHQRNNIRLQQESLEQMQAQSNADQHI